MRITSRAVSVLLKEFHNLTVKKMTRAYRVTHVVAEKLMLTAGSKFRQRPASKDELTAERNF